MKIGLYTKWPKGVSSKYGYNLHGDELYADSMCQELEKNDAIESANRYYPNSLPKEKLDVMIYLNDTSPHHQWARKHVLYLQNGYGEGSDKVLEKLRDEIYDGFAFISNKLLEIHRSDGFEGIFLPFGVNTDLFYPVEKKEQYSYDVAYIGNDIKGEERTTQYILPAIKYNFALYGNWRNPKPRLRRKIQFWRPIGIIPEYKEILFNITKGKIPQAEVPFIYSSAKINLNCTLQDCVDWDVITLRTYEVLACKGFLITDKVKIAEKTMHECIIFTDGGTDLSEKIKYYLHHPEEREKYAQRGYEYVSNTASLKSRMNTFTQYLEKIQ
jgi:spore maturation protein CgeB